MVYRKRIFLSYVAIMVIPIILNNFLLFWSFSNRETSLKKDYMYVQVKQLRSTVDYMINKIRGDIVFLSYRDELRDLRSWYQTANYREHKAFMSALTPFSILADYYDEAVIFNPDQDFMLDLKAKLVSPIQGTRQEERIRKVLQFVDADQAKQESLISLDVDGSSATFLIKNLQTDPKGPRTILFIQFSNTFFKSLLDDIFLIDRSYVLILNHNFELVRIREKDVDARVSDYRDLIPNEDYSGHAGYATINGHKYLVCAEESPDQGWQYFYGVDNDSIRADISITLLQFSIFAVLIIVIFLFAASYLARGIYQPVYETVKLLQAAGYAEMTDEFSMIQTNIQSLLRRSAELSNTRPADSRIESDAFLRSLLSSAGMTRQEISESVSTLKLSIITDRGTKYRVYECLFKNNAEELLAALPEDSPKTRRERVLDCFIPLATSRYQAVQSDEHTWTIIESITSKMAGDNPPLLNPIFKDGSVIALSASRIHDSPERLYEASREARIALDYRTMFPAGHIVAYDEVVGRKNRGYFYPVETEQKIIAHLKQLDYAGAVEQYSHFCETVSKSGISIQSTRHIYFHLMDSLMNLSRDFDLSIDLPASDAGHDFWTGLETAVSAENLIETVGAVLKQLFDRLQSTKESPTIVIANAVKDFIDQHFSERNLSLDLIASDLRYSVSHLSSVFRDTFGETIKNYITGLRLTTARSLLSDTDLQVTRIAEQVGYDNIGSFVKIFKAYIGETPKEYRLRIRRK